jgi:ketose-bisphosphate aldolase
MTLTEKLNECNSGGKAVLAANFYNFETLRGIILAAQAGGDSIILQLSESSINYLGIDTAVSLARAELRQSGVQGWLHLDHGNRIELVQRCLDAGFDSVMIDYSEKPFLENVRVTSEVVKIAAKYGANVEAELGFVAKLGQQQNEAKYTSPEEAKLFANATGVNALAIAIGSAHGFYKTAPNIRIDILQQIHAKTNIPLVLHGSSGIPDKMLQDAIQNGISKINLATETKNAFMKSVKNLLADSDEIDLRVVFPKAIQEVTDLISHKLKIIRV